MDAWEPPYSGPDEPSCARIHNALLGGRNYTTADEAEVAEIEKACPGIRQMALDSRLFTARAVGWAADRGICQFIDLGAGLPPGEAVHDLARAVLPGARVAYVDRDEEVTDDLGDTMPGDGIAVVNGDLRDPAAVMSDPELRAVIDPDQPVLILATWVLHFMAADRAREVVAGYARLIAPGSYVVISCGRCENEGLWKQLSEVYTAADLYNHSSADVAEFLGSLELVPPGLVAAQRWRGGWHDVPATPPGPVYVLAGVAKK
jgi:hypothetical protein